MKTQLLILFITLCGVVSPQWMRAGHVPTEGQWGEDGYRSFVPAPPSVSIEGNVLSVHFIDTLSDLTICVMDSRGQIVYESVISEEGGNDYCITLDENLTGDFQIFLKHKRGVLYGAFTIL